MSRKFIKVCLGLIVLVCICALSGCGNFAVSDEIDENVINTIENVYWDKVPESQRKMLEDNWTVVFAKEMPGFMNRPFSNNSNDMIGCAVYFGKDIWVQSDTNEITEIYIHEFGHALAYELGSIDTSIKWLSLYHDYKDVSKGIVSDYNRQDSMEFFAGCYQMYFTDGEYLQEKLPEIYDYMDEINHTEYSDDIFSQTIIFGKSLFNNVLWFITFIF